MYHIGIISVVPSPYQRDLFAALDAHPEVDLSVYYEESDTAENPWPTSAMGKHEAMLPGIRLGSGAMRLHVNWGMPDLGAKDLIILNTSYFSVAPQWLMRAGIVGTPWVFWGERLRHQDRWLLRLGQQALTSPLRRASAIVAIGSLAEQAYRRRFPDQPVFNIPYHCDLTGFHLLSPTGRDDKEEVVFLFCGQMIARKGVDLLLKAFEQLLLSGIPARLVLVGREAELPDMLGSVRYDTRARIDFKGFRAPQDLPEIFGAADVFVLPSRHDGWGVVVNQALGAGMPIICSDAVGAAYDLVTPEANGTVVPAGEVEPLKQAMEHLACNNEVRAKWGAESRRISEEWTPSCGAEKLVQLARAVLSGTS